MKTNIEMAREAGVRDDGHRFEFSEYKYLERFAVLVRADERDCVMNEPITKAHWQRFENDIRADEREACALVSEDCGAIHVAKRIRARGNT